MINRNRQDQSGHAALLFALMIPLLFGVFILGTDGARALQSKARLEEASEAAALVIAGDSNSSDEEKKELAKSYISYYFPHAQIEKIAAKTIPCEMNAHCNSSLSASQRFFEYQVSADISEPNWFSTESITTSFGSDTNKAGYSSTRKYQSQAVDVIIVADFSGSMRYADNDSELKDKLNLGDSRSKYIQLISVIKQVTTYLSEFNSRTQESVPKSTIGFVGFDFFVRNDIGMDSYYSYLICNGNLGNISYNQGWCIKYPQYVDLNSTIQAIYKTNYFKPLSRSDINYAREYILSDVDKPPNLMPSFIHCR